MLIVQTSFYVNMSHSVSLSGFCKSNLIDFGSQKSFRESFRDDFFFLQIIDC